jgi:sortase A
MSHTLIDPSELSIEELERLLTEKQRQARAAKRFSVQLEPRQTIAERGAQKIAELGERHKPRIDWSRVGSRALLGMEVIALLGIAAVLLAGFFKLQELNQETSNIQAQANTPQTTNSSAQPAAIATLPSSPQPPSAVTPDRFKDTLQQVVPVALPTPGPQAPVRVEIPVIKVDSLVVLGDDWEALKKGVGHHVGSANPGQRGNLVLSGHNDIYGEVFRQLEKLKTGDEVYVYTRSQKFTYVVKSKRVVEPTEVSVMAQTTEPTLTLITCYPYLVDTHRMIVFAQLVK